MRKFLAMGGQRAISLFDAMGAFVGWVCAMHATVGFVSCPGKGGIHRRLASGRKRDPGATVPRGGPPGMVARAAACSTCRLRRW